jgi:hypothetical protein
VKNGKRTASVGCTRDFTTHLFREGDRHTVENTNGDSLGHIEEIDKISGRVGYAVLNSGSFLGMGGKLFALPWDVLKYDTSRSAYVVGIPEERLKGAPSYDAGTEPN